MLQTCLGSWPADGYSLSIDLLFLGYNASVNQIELDQKSSNIFFIKHNDILLSLQNLRMYTLGNKRETDNLY